jgi:predicted aspartyl protease
MRTWGRLLGAVGIISITATSPAGAGQKCQLVEVASVDMGTDQEGEVYIPMTIAGHEEKMLVDTGGMYTTITAAAADRMGLNRQTINQVDQDTQALQFFGRHAITQLVQGNGIDLGGLKASQMTMFVMPDKMLSPQLGGTLAPDIMRKYDVDFDFAKGKFNLFSQDHCDGQVVYWTQSGYAQVEIGVDSNGHITVPVTLDGQEVKAAIDTGAPVSILRLEKARSLFGWDDKNTGLKPVGEAGVDSDHTVYRYPFHTLTFGGIEVLNPAIELYPDKLSGMKNEHPVLGGYGVEALGSAPPSMILGIGILRQLHLYIAYRERNLYATGATAK